MGRMLFILIDLSNIHNIKCTDLKYISVDECLCSMTTTQITRPPCPLVRSLKDFYVEEGVSGKNVYYIFYF